MDNIYLNKVKSVFANRVGKIIIFALLVVVLGGVIFWKNLHRSSADKPQTTSGTNVTLASVPLDKKIEVTAIRVVDKKPILVGFSLIDGELKSQIKYKDNPISTSGDKQFLLIKLEINNSSPDRLAITSGDLIRLNIDSKLYAPDYHNGTVVIEPISVRPDQVVFVVDKSQKVFKLSIGEPSGQREDLEVKFN